MTPSLDHSTAKCCSELRPAPASALFRPLRWCAVGVLRLRYVTAVLAIACSFAPLAHAEQPVPRPEEDDEALHHYERAIALHADEAYDAALVELRRAYELRPSYKLVFNIAQVQFAMKDYAAALASYRQYLTEGGVEVPDKRRSEIEAQIATLEQRVATLTITTDVPGVEVFLDDTLVGMTPELGPLLVNAGTRKFTLRHSDHETHSERISVLGGTHRQLAFSLSRRSVTETSVVASARETAHAPMPTTSQVQTDVSPEAAPSPTEWIPWAITGVLGAAAIGTGVVTLSANAKLSDMRDETDVGTSALRDQSNHVDNLALATDLLLGATLVTAGVSAWLTWGDTNDTETTSTSPPLQFTLSPRSAVLSGRF